MLGKVGGLQHPTQKLSGCTSMADAMYPLASVTLKGVGNQMEWEVEPYPAGKEVGLGILMRTVGHDGRWGRNGTGSVSWVLPSAEHHSAKQWGWGVTLRALFSRSSNILP